MPEPSSVAWDDVRHAYVATPEPIKSLCARFGITPLELAAERKARGWPPRPSPIRQTAKHATATRATSPLTARTTKTRKAKRARAKPRARLMRRAEPSPSAMPAAPAPRAKVVAKRLATIIARKLERMEQQLADGELPSHADSEREARALGVMIQNFERLKGLVQATSDTTPDTAAQPLPTSDVNDAPNLDELRRDLAQRLARLVDDAAPQGPGEPDSG